MICPNCGSQVREGVQFCPTCGTRQGEQGQPQQPQQEYGAQQPQQVQTYQQQAQAYGTAGRPASSGTKTHALVGMICGIAGIILTFTPISIVGLICAIVGIVASAMGMKRNQGGMAIAGLVCGIIALVIWVAAAICVGMIFGAAATAYNGAMQGADGLQDLANMLDNLS